MSEWVGVHLYAPTHAAHAVIPPLPPPAPPALPCRAVLPPCLAPPLPLPQNQFLQWWSAWRRSLRPRRLGWWPTSIWIQKCRGCSPRQVRWV